MEIFRNIEALTRELEGLRKQGKVTGFVPTMGALHEGHMSLVKRSQQENDITVVDIFVNAAQFNDPEDFKRYPKDIEADMQKLENAGCNILFLPSASEIESVRKDTRFDLGGLDAVMEGKHRPGHFAGVAMIVDLLFTIVKPQRAYFGEKDFQQLAVIRHLVKHNSYNGLQIVSCPTVREPDGLAMSSRNMLLGAEERRNAPIIFKALQEAQSKAALVNVARLRTLVCDMINANEYLEVEYFEIVDRETLLPLQPSETGVGAVGCIAVRAGKIRLIDNITFN